MMPYDAEYRRAWAAKTNAPSMSRRARRRAKLKMRYGNRLRQAIADTREKLSLLIELKTEEEQRFINGEAVHDERLG